MPTKQLPHNIDAEQSIIGSMFISKNALIKACEAIDKDIFYVDSHSKIFEVLYFLYENNIPVDVTTVTSEIKKRKLLKEVGGIEYITDILNSVPTAANIDYYIQMVEEAAILRNLIESATDICTMAYDEERNIAETLDNAEKRIFNVVKNRRTGEFQKIQNVLFEAQTNLERLSQSGGEVIGIPSGFYELDKLTTGFHANELIILAARPSVGKTALALNIVSSVALNTDHAVAIFSMEMDAAQLVTRMISSVGQIEGQKLQTGLLSNNDWKRVNEAISQLADTKIFIDDTAVINVNEIRAKCRRIANSETGLGLVVIDYLQLMPGSDRYRGNRQQEIAEISRSLKTMALELGVPVIAIAQLSRDVEKRENKRPILSDLRESGSIEQDADIVMFIHTEDYYQKTTERDNSAIYELIIRKHRNGPTGSVNLLFKRDTATFVNYKKESD